MTKDLSISYWEQRHHREKQDFIIVGGGFTGWSVALHLRTWLPSASIRVVEQLQQCRVASTRNAGFACFGSLTEFIRDYRRHPDKAVDLFAARYRGIQRLLELVSGHDIGYMKCGGFEPLRKRDWDVEEIRATVDEANAALQAAAAERPFRIDHDHEHGQLFAGHHLVFMPYEGQLDPVRLLHALRREGIQAGIDLMEGVELVDLSSDQSGVQLETSCGEMSARQVLLATNARWLPRFNARLAGLRPARNTVLVTRPLGLPLKGIYHVEEGYLYFRNTPDGRLLLGGGRHWNKEEAYTNDMEVDRRTVERLVDYVAELFGRPRGLFEPELTWAGTICEQRSGDYSITSLASNVTYIGGYNGMGIALAAEAAYQGVHQIVTT